MLADRLKDAASATPDPERSLKNLSTFCNENPDYVERLKTNLRSISLLFSNSQFLANFCISNAGALFDAIENIERPFDKENLHAALRNAFLAEDQLLTPHVLRLTPYMKAVREFKKIEILRITLRDILKKAELVETMFELSMLADVIVEEALMVVRRFMNGMYGEPKDDAFSVISLGKLGGEELNFSSDIDLIFVYGTEIGETSGVMTHQGISMNKISNHEYYCKLGENLNRFLSMNTEDGFAYRVDLRLRPEGQRGDLALSLGSSEMYYESWGRAWERAVLLRARPIAGDVNLGRGFMEMIRPFVHRKYLDFSAIDEIRQMKSRIDVAFKKDDIKRGYGGIREIEFFAQALQLIYGGKEPLLRERSTLRVLHRLLQKSLIGQEDYLILDENYKFLRTLEHRLQQLNDLQTHTLPSDERELEALGKKMGFDGMKSFISDLDKRRNRVRDIYDSLFREKRGEALEGGMLFDEELSDTELREYLAGAGLKDVGRGMRNIQHIRDSIFSFQTLHGRRLLSEILPIFVDKALKCSNPDMALDHLQSFASLLSSRESYLDVFKENRELIPVLTSVFSQSEYLSKMIIGKPDYLELIAHGGVVRKSLKAMKDELRDSIAGGQSISEAIRLVRKMEEIRLGLLFLQKKISVVELIKGVSKAAEAILSVSHLSPDLSSEGLAVVGFGKLGGREITFNSDLDIIFVCTKDVTQSHTKAAERLLRLLISYTREGVAYRVDTRLRPDGTKGPLVSSIDAFKNYYSKGAASWELQALMKARPVGGDIKTGLCFMDMAKDILIKRGKEISATNIKAMRERIQRELSREAEGYDIKLGPGGIEEIEFTVQYLQLSNCFKYAGLLVQGTVAAINRLMHFEVIEKFDGSFLKNTYLFLRTIESFLKLRGATVLNRADKDMKQAVAEFMGFPLVDDFIRQIEESRQGVRRLYNSIVTSGK